MSMKVAPSRQRRSPESEAETVRAGPGRAKPCSTVKAEAAHHSVPQWPSLIKQHRKTPAHCPVSDSATLTPPVCAHGNWQWEWYASLLGFYCICHQQEQQQQHRAGVAASVTNLGLLGKSDSCRAGSPCPTPPCFPFRAVVCLCHVSVGIFSSHSHFHPCPTLFIALTHRIIITQFTLLPCLLFLPLPPSTSVCPLSAYRCLWTGESAEQLIYALQAGQLTCL